MAITMKVKLPKEVVWLFYWKGRGEMKKNRVHKILLILLIFFIMTLSKVLSFAAYPKISAGRIHSVAIKSDGTLWTWGRNNFGQLGDGSLIDRHCPIQVGSDNDWTSAEAGYGYTIAMKSNGTLWAWGENGVGQLGDGTGISKNYPVRIGTDNDWVSIAVGYGHNFAQKADGTLWGWGGNGFGTLGDGTWNSKMSPIQIGTDNDWVSIAAGNWHTVALKLDGTLWGWGFNGFGQLGVDTTIDRYFYPIQVGSDKDWVSIAVGVYHTLAQKSNGTLWACGQGQHGQLGLGHWGQVNSPTQIGLDDDWIYFEGGYQHTIALKSDGTLWGWGYNTAYTQTKDTHTPVQIEINDDWFSISSKYDHNLALKFDGSLWAWGFNDYGAVGDCTTTNRYAPVRIYEDMPILINVEIDIKPKSYPNSINPRSKGKIPVAILSAMDFDASTEVDTESLTFGPIGDEKSLAFCSRSPEDVNDDGYYDLICHFYTQKAEFKCGNEKGILKGLTFEGTPVEGGDSVRIVPSTCR